MGGASTYASLGILATFAADFRFPLGPGVFGAGLLSGLCALDASGAAASAQVLIVPIGADVRYSMNEGGFPGIVIHVSGGPAMMNVTADYAGSLTKLVPYLLAGMSLELPFASFIRTFNRGGLGGVLRERFPSPHGIRPGGVVVCAVLSA